MEYRQLVSLLLAFNLLLAGCASSPPSQQEVPPQRSWPEHRERILDSDRWSLQGRLNIRGSNDSNTVSIRWRQDGDDFLINLSGTLGLGAVAITGNNNGVRVEQSGREPVNADSLSELSVYYLGYEFPAYALYYWVRGVPAPAGNARINLNDNDLLASLSQRDVLGNMWRLQYDRYRPVGDVMLPGRIVMQHPDYRLTFLIDNWRLGAGSAS